MGKKIRLDFSKVEERSGYNSKAIPEGLHKMKITDVNVGEAQDSTPMLTFALVPTDSRYKARKFPYYCKLQPNQMFKIRDLLVAAGVEVPKKVVSIDPDSVVGKLVAVEVGDATGQYAGRSEINGVYGLDVLDEDGDVAEDTEDEESEEEEYDDEAEEADEEYEDEEDVEDEDEDELATLTLPELRKRAKGLGIVTTGLKQAELIEAIQEAEAEEDDEDEEDLDDEELEDEDLDEEEFEEDEDDEEEEEPAPAPRKRAPAKAPAKAAPAKRVIKRR